MKLNLKEIIFLCCNELSNRDTSFNKNKMKLKLKEMIFPYNELSKRDACFYKNIMTLNLKEMIFNLICWNDSSNRDTPKQKPRTALNFARWSYW